MPDTTLATPSVRIEDVDYCRHGGRTLAATLYRPQGPGPFPAVVEVHGGHWTRNDRSANRVLMTELARRGILGLSLDFRMPPEARYPASLADIAAGVRWMKASAARLGADPAQIGLIGTSSGGHQALLLALRHAAPHYRPEQPGPDGADASVAFVVACWPIVDVIQRYRMALKRRPDLAAGHEAYWDGEAAMEEASPQHILDRGEQDATPRALILQGTLDNNIDHETIEPFAAAWRRPGGALAAWKFDGAPHRFIAEDLSPPAVARAVGIVERFIKEPGVLEAVPATRWIDFSTGLDMEPRG